MQDSSDAINAGDLLKKAEHLFRYAQVGRCVSSVTHDVNNLLGAILAYAELIGLEESLSEESARMLKEIMNAVRRSSTLITNLTDVARKERADIRVVQPFQILERVLSMCQYDLKVSHIECEVDCPEELAAIALDVPKLQRAMMSVVGNAIEHEPDSSGRRVILRGGANGDRLDFSVWNSGTPVPPEDRERIFDPLYTTKGDEHMGLGLTIARQAARLHQGDMFYDPERGFVISLPSEGLLPG